MQMPTVRATFTLDASLYEQAKEVAERLEVSRSRLIATALRDFLERRRSAQILEALNEVYGDDLDAEERRFLRGGSAAIRAIAEGED
jgi:predicted transcriptional regulator